MYDGANTEWQLTSFDNRDGQLSGAFPISREQFIRVRELFDYGDDEWFSDSYPITPELWPQVIEILSCPPPEPGKSYYIDGYATAW
ncbi:hypothetical protein [Actinomadura sp. 6N118]|uniref:hypothetical protein n=1 Tax=Actinomadura sp. 6N118 TaxID=3375151 RepID=UPI0037C11587